MGRRPSVSIITVSFAGVAALSFAFLSLFSENFVDTLSTGFEKTCQMESEGAEIPISWPFVINTATSLKLPTEEQETEKMEQIHGVKIWRNPSESILSDLGVSGWKKWSGEPSKFPWTFDSGNEKMYLLKGKVKVYRQGYEHTEEPFEIGGGDLVEFPSGMKIVWEVIEAVEKHYLLF